MSMSKDLKNEEFRQKLNNALQSGEQDQLVQAFTDFADGVKQEVMADAKIYKETGDMAILQKRGIHQLTSQEKEFYQKWKEAAESNNPRQALTNLDIGLPQTIIDNVMEDMRNDHPLLNAIDFQSATALTKILVNKQGKQLAQWGPINSAITKELEGTIDSIDLSLNKLTAFLPVYKDMLQIGPQWVDSYVRAVLSEAVAFALEEAIINGTGKNMPIGMNRQIGDDVNIVGGVHPKKDKISIVDLSPVTIGSLISELAKDDVEPTKARNVDGLILIVNPFDYFTKVFPATTYMTPNGTYVNNVLPYPIQIIQSQQLNRDEAILGIASKYKMGLGTGSQKGGKIEYSDEYKFLEDQRYYIIKLIANGQALHNNDFLFLDLSQLKPIDLKIKLDNEELKTIVLSSAAGTDTGDTKITTGNVLNSGNSYVYKVGDSVTMPVLNQTLVAWSKWDGTSDITAATGKTIVIAEVDGINRVKGVGKATVTAKA